MSASPTARQHLDTLRRRYSVGQVLGFLEAFKSLRVLVVGDVILDEYHYCRAVGKASKSATLTARFLSEERHAGGALAVANHVAGFAAEVTLLTYLGSPASDEEFICSHLRPNIRPVLVEQPERPNVVKRRYVEPFQVSKIFEIFWLDGEQPLPAAEDRLLERLDTLLPDCDLVVVADFGHGAVGSRTIDRLAASSAFLSVNAQTNSANLGYNLITKYPRANFICIDEEEMRLANHSRYGDLAEMTETTARNLGSRLAAVTRGVHGSLVYGPNGFVATPVLSRDVVDSVGAGDAYLSLASLCAHAGHEPEIIGFLGGCIGALAVRIVGNREPVDPQELVQMVENLLEGAAGP